MYKAFYGLNRNPFGISPDPYFYYATPKHNEALANLWYGIDKRKGFIVLSGEVGTGKTLVVHYLLQQLVKTRVRYAYIFNPRLSPDDFLHYMMCDMGIPQPKTNRSEMLLQFNQFLIDVYRQGSAAALIIDEAHLLSPDLLEEIRLLTNVETSQQKLLQIVLAGQPELDALLDSPELRQLKQRIALRCRLQPLDEADAYGYIVRRLQLAGAGDRAITIFPKPTVARILSYSRGIPRLVNTICDSALINGYARREASITPETIEEVAADLRLNLPETKPPEPETVEQTDRKLIIRSLLRLAKLLEPSQENRGRNGKTEGVSVQ
jgi:general secretion pathway protein A